MHTPLGSHGNVRSKIYLVLNHPLNFTYFFTLVIFIIDLGSIFSLPMLSPCVFEDLPCIRFGTHTVHIYIYIFSVASLGIVSDLFKLLFFEQTCTIKMPVGETFFLYLFHLNFLLFIAFFANLGGVVIYTDLFSSSQLESVPSWSLTSSYLSSSAY